MTIKRNINGIEMEIELTFDEILAVEKELKIKDIMYDIDNEAKDMEVNLANEQINELAKRVLEWDEEHAYYYGKNYDHTEYIQELLEEITEEE